MATVHPGANPAKPGLESETVRRAPLVRYVPVALTLVVGAVLSLVGFSLLRGWEQVAIHSRFGRVADQCAAALASEFQADLLLLEAPRGFFYGSDAVSRQEFGTFARPFLARVDQTVAWEWLPRVPDRLRSEYEALARRDGFPKFTFRERDGNGGFVPARRRDEYFPLYYLEPLPRNASVLGFDVATDPHRKATMERACDTAALVAVPGTFLTAQPGPPVGFLAFLPVFQQISLPATVADRRQGLRGFILGTYRLDIIVEKALRQLRPEGVIVQLVDVTDARQRLPLYCCPGSAGAIPAPQTDERLTHRHQFDVAGRRMEVQCVSNAEYVTARRTWQPWIVLAAGVTLTGVLAARFLAGVREAVRVERLVAERTSDLCRSEQEIRTILDTVQVGIAVVDASNRQIVTVNPVALAMLGGDKEQIVGRDCQSLICTTKCGECPVLATGRMVRNAECVLRSTTRGLVPVLKTVAPVTLSGKSFLLETLIDISDRQRMEDTLRASEEKFRSISDSALDAVVLVDPVGTVIHWNPAAERIFGLARTEIVGQAVLSLLAAQHQVNSREVLRRISDPVWKNDLGATIEVTAVRKDGSQFPLEISLGRIKIEGRWGVVAIGRDITGRKAAELELQRRAMALESANRELNDAKQAAEAANSAKSEFLTNMSHELRTPLHGILSFAALGVRRNQTLTPEERLEFFQLIQQSGNNLLQLINALLDLAKLESGRMDFSFAPVDLQTAIPVVIDELRSLAEDHQLTIALSCSAADASIHADRTRLLQVVRNLLSNAIKFSPAGTAIQVDIADRAQSLVVSVRDHGIGIPDEELTAIFDKFIQSSKTRTGAGGTGLGLAICREIIQAHGGRIWAANRPEGGAELVFEIPRQASRLAPVETVPAIGSLNTPQPVAG